MNKIQKTPAGLNCPIILLEEFLTVDNDNVSSCISMHFFLLTRENFPSRNKQNTENTSHGGSPSEEFVAIDDDNVCETPIVTDKDILEFVQSSKNIIDVESDDENKMNNASPVTSSKMRSIMKSISSYLDAYFNGAMNNKMHDIEQCVDYLILSK
ncbi:hypothetical protein TNCV_3744751 [Trichonephila clavipes]|nr:hypothetical protein TNCV_3744751 [Trichonephila clavipes]